MNCLSFFKLGWLTLFGIAMAYLEAAVVIYLRQLFWPTGLAVISLETLQPMPPFLLAVEIGREAATIIMLASLSIRSARITGSGLPSCGSLASGTFSITCGSTFSPAGRRRCSPTTFCFSSLSPGLGR